MSGTENNSAFSGNNLSRRATKAIPKQTNSLSKRSTNKETEDFSMNGLNSNFVRDTSQN